MNRKLYILIAILAALLVLTLALIFTLRPGTPAQPAATPEPTVLQTAEPAVGPEETPDALATDDPLAGLTEDEIGALAMAEENHDTPAGED